MSETMNSKEVAEYLGVSEKTVNNYCKQGLLTFYRLGGRGRYNIYRNSVEKLVESSKKEATFNNPNYTLNKEKEI